MFSLPIVLWDAHLFSFILIHEGSNICYSSWIFFLFFHSWVQLLLHTKNTYVHYLFVFILAFIMQSLNIIKYKIATLHRLFQTQLIPMQKWIKKLSNSFVFINTSHDFSVIPLINYQTIFIAVFWWHEVLMTFCYWSVFCKIRFFKFIYVNCVAYGFQFCFGGRF